MNRRAFLIKGVLAAVGLTALPAASALANLSVALQAKEAEVTDGVPTEAEVMEDILLYVESWDEELPGHNFRELLFRRLVGEKTGLTYGEFINHLWKHADKAEVALTQDVWIHHALAISGS